MGYERDEGSLYDHLPATPPDWFAFPLHPFCCRVFVPGEVDTLHCFGLIHDDLDSLREHLQTQGHKVLIHSSPPFTNLLTL